MLDTIYTFLQLFRFVVMVSVQQKKNIYKLIKLTQIDTIETTQ